jgi:hypothetical protein
MGTPVCSLGTLPAHPISVQTLPLPGWLQGTFYHLQAVVVRALQASAGPGSAMLWDVLDQSASWQERLSKANLDATIQAAPRDPAAAGKDIMMEKQLNFRMCFFVCGIENPIGLRLAFYTDDEGRCVARFRPGPEHQGYPG